MWLKQEQYLKRLQLAHEVAICFQNVQSNSLVGRHGLKKRMWLCWQKEFHEFFRLLEDREIYFGEYAKKFTVWTELRDTEFDFELA